MGHLIQVEIPDEVFAPLAEKAKVSGVTPAQFIAERMAIIVKDGEMTEGQKQLAAFVKEWSGCISCGDPHAAENHDEYLAEEYMDTHSEK